MGSGSLADFLGGLFYFGAIVVVVWHFGDLGEFRRRGRNRRYARVNGWHFSGRDRGLVEAFASHPFGIGRRRNATDAARGEVGGREFIAFGYEYVTGVGKETTTHWVHVYSVEMPGHVPLVSIAPLNPAPSLAGASGGAPVDVTSREFNRQWRVTSDDAGAARAILTRAMITRLLEPDLTGYAVTFEPGLLVMCADGKLDLKATPPPFEALSDIAGLVPKSLARDYPEV